MGPGAFRKPCGSGSLTLPARPRLPILHRLSSSFSRGTDFLFCGLQPFCPSLPWWTGMSVVAPEAQAWLRQRRAGGARPSRWPGRLVVLLGRCGESPVHRVDRKPTRKALHERLRCFLEKKPRRGQPSRDGRRRRNAIRLTSEHTVETLVVADADMVQYHGAEAAQRFILTVMNMVSRLAPGEGSACGAGICSWLGGGLTRRLATPGQVGRTARGPGGHPR